MVSGFLTPRKVPFQNFPPALALLGHGFRAVLAQAHAVAVAAGRKGKCVLPRVIVHGERCRPQTERAAQPCPGKHLPADRHLRQIPRFVPHTLAEPVGGGVLYLLRRKAKAKQGGIDLLGAVGDGHFIPRHVGVPR